MLVNNAEERNRMDMDSRTAARPLGCAQGEDDKQLARLNIIKDMLSRLHYADKDERLILPDSQIVFAYDAAYLEGDQLAK